MACSNCYTGCTAITTDKCVKYTGQNIELLGIKNGDSLSYINSVIIGFLSSTLDGSGIKIDLDQENLCANITNNFPDCGEINIVHIINALAKAVCSIQTQINDTDGTVEEINLPYDVMCVSPTLMGDEGTHVILQATINRLCDLVTEVANIKINSNNNYVKVEDINDYIGEWAENHPQINPGTGLTITSSNPVQSLAVGSDGVASILKEYNVSIQVFRDGSALSPTSGNATPTSDWQYLLETPPPPKAGINVTKISNNTLKYTVLNGTTFTEATVVSNIIVRVAQEQLQMNTSFSIVPVFTAEDNMTLELVSSAVVIKYDSWGGLIGPNTIALQAMRQGYTTPILWETIPPGILPSHSVGDTNRNFDATTLFANNREEVGIKISTPNGLWDQVTIVKVQDGAQGPAGGGGSGFSVTSSNPVQSIAVGSDGIASIQRIYDATIKVFSDSEELIATSGNANPSAANQFLLVLPSSPLSGVTVTKTSNNTLRFTVGQGTTFTNETLNVLIDIIATDELTPLTTNFTLIPIFTADDAHTLSINSTSTVVKYDANDVLKGPSTVTLEAIQQNYNETITWETLPPGIPSSNGATSKIKIFTAANLFSGSREQVSVKISTPNGLWDQVTIVKVKDGSDGNDGNDGPQGEPGAPGIQGTTGMIPRLMEWAPGASYEINGDYIDYVYYRTSNATYEGWYTVKIVPPGNTNRIVAIANAGSPDPAKFEKQPFTSSAQFGTVIAEQANIAGFIFRNQVLTSQAKSPMICEGVSTLYNNLTIDGVQGVIKFLERMQLDKDGIVLKDDCQRPRMKFQWLNGLPVLEFLNEAGNIVWSAGENGYVYITTGTQPPKWGSRIILRRVTSLMSEDINLATVQYSLNTNFRIISNVPLRNDTMQDLEADIVEFLQLNCDGGPVTAYTSYFAVFKQDAFPAPNPSANIYGVYKYTKGDMSGNLDNYEGYYISQTAIKNNEVDTAPAGTFVPDGWYYMEGDTGRNRNNSAPCSATIGIDSFLEEYDEGPIVTGYYPVSIVYFEKGSVMKFISLIGEKTWQKA